MSTKDEVRSILGMKPKRTTLDLELDGKTLKVDVVAPSILVREQFYQRHEKEGSSRAAAYLIVACTVLTGTDERPFEDADIEKLAHLEADEGAPYSILARTALDFISGGIKAVRKKSEPIPSAD